MNWYIGQRCVCVDASGVNGVLVKGLVYIVRGVHQCSHGRTVLDVGSRPTVWPWDGTTAMNCGCVLSGCWKGQARFRPIDALTETMERIEKEGAPIEQPQPELA